MGQKKIIQFDAKSSFGRTVTCAFGAQERKALHRNERRKEENCCRKRAKKKHLVETE